MIGSRLALIVGYLVQQTGVTPVTIVVLTVPFVLQARWRRSKVIGVRRDHAHRYHHPDDVDALASAS